MVDRIERNGKIMFLSASKQEEKLATAILKKLEEIHVKIMKLKR